MTRPTVDDVLMRCAFAWADRGTCTLAQVGAVIARDGRVLSSGYNGAPQGLAHCVHETYVVPRVIPDGSFPPWVVVAAERLTEVDYVNLADVFTYGTTLRRDNDTYTVTRGGQPAPTCQIAVHAEANAVAFAALNGVPLLGATLYTTLAPCLACAQLIVQAGIGRVVAARPYRLSAGIDLLRSAEVEIEVEVEE